MLILTFVNPYFFMLESSLLNPMHQRYNRLYKNMFVPTVIYCHNILQLYTEALALEEGRDDILTHRAQAYLQLGQPKGKLHRISFFCNLVMGVTVHFAINLDMSGVFAS